VATGTILNNDTATGSFGINPEQASSAVGEVFPLAFSWIAPEPQNWRVLRTMDLRIRDENETILWIRWDQATNRFAVFNSAAGKFGPSFEPGRPNRLESSTATLLLNETYVVPGGPDAPDVTLNLALVFKPKAAGRTYAIEVAASDDIGNQEDFAPAGTLVVAAK
jgi:hypothetical protein